MHYTTLSVRSSRPPLVFMGTLVGFILSPNASAGMAGFFWFAALLCLIVSAISRPAWRSGPWVAPALVGYSLLLLFAQPSARTDGDAAAAAFWSAVWLIPIVAGGVIM